MRFEEAIEKLNAYKTSGIDADMTAFFTELEFATLDVEQWPDSFVTGVSELLGDNDFHRLPDSWKLLHFLNNNWEQLAGKQRSALREILATSFDSYSDSMGAFVTAEILGEHYCDKATLDVFARLAKEAAAPANAFVPHGLEVFANTTPQTTLRELAITQLRLLSRSASGSLGREATDALRRLQRTTTSQH